MPNTAVADAPEAPPAEADRRLPRRALPRALRRAPRLADRSRPARSRWNFRTAKPIASPAADAPAATIVLRHAGAVRRVLAGKPLGLAEAYIDGWWTTPDLREVMALALANEADWGELDRRHRSRARGRGWWTGCMDCVPRPCSAGGGTRPATTNSAPTFMPAGWTRR